MDQLREFNALSTKSKNACIKAPNTLNPVRLIKNPPDKTPINNEITTFFVINANTIATIGGINVNSPNLICIHLLPAQLLLQKQMLLIT